MPSDKGTHIATEAFRILRTLYQLSTDLFASQNRKDLNFRILNNTIRLFPYNRAVLWSFDQKKPKLIGVSGQEDVKSQSPLARHWKEIVTSLKEKQKLRILSDDFKHKDNQWQTLASKTSGLSVMWVPILENGVLRAGLWLERWGEKTWDAGECEVMSSLAQSYRLAWKQFYPISRWFNHDRTRFYRISMALAGVLLISLLYFQTIPLRVIAPCEIIPKDPVAIAAPLSGVIKEILVQPGERVQEGHLLFSYDDRVIMQDLKVSQTQVQDIASRYNQARHDAFKDQAALEKMQRLQSRLEQEQVRLNLAESNARHLLVRAPSGGVCMVDHPDFWRGRAVQMGERIVTLFRPGRNKVKIFLPEDDKVQFDWEKPVRVVLTAYPASEYEARLNYMAPQTSENPHGGTSFLAEADLIDADARIKVGSKGSAIVYGERVRLGYWLIRKPLSGVRTFLGI